MPALTDTFQNLYTYIISIAGAIALMVLIIGGILYLTSTGEPEKLDKAKKQILAALFGIIILLSSYLILRTINPELVSFEMPRLKKIIFHPLDMPPLETKVPKLLGGIEEIAEQLKENIIPGIEYSAEKIKELTDDDHCKCENTQPLCYCTGGGSGSECQPRQCYAGPGFQPCPDEPEIKENQKRIIAWKDEILYYKNRAVVEEEDLKDEIKNVLDEKIVYYAKNIIIEDDEEVKQYLTEKKQEVTKEKNLKKDLGAKIKELTDLIKKIEPYMSEITQLADKCLYDEEGVFGVDKKCQPSCKKGKEYGCHDTKEGCQPDKCDGGNPCPAGEINDQLLLIQGLRPQIMNKCNEILNVIDEIIKHKTITI